MKVLSFTFKDSRPGQKQEGKHLPKLFRAIEKLNEAARKDEIQLVYVAGKRRRYTQDFPEIITYAVTGSSRTSSWDTVTEASFDVSHYIGTYSTSIDGVTVTIEIKPRWGSGILHYLLRHTTGIYMPPDATSGIQSARDSAEWLLVLLWKSLFNQALRTFHIPKEYQVKRTNDRIFKGRLDVQRQIRENLADQSRFCCIHAPLSLDTTINRTIRYLFRLLSRNKAYAVLLSDVAGYDERLASFGVKECQVSPAEIDHIRFTRMSEGYRPLMQISKALIRRFGASAGDASDNTSFFIDVAELWENYLEAILTKHLPAPYRVINPNKTGGEWLIVDRNREIRPDLVIEKDGVPAAILDAKFKAYSQIGKFEADGVRREDLYQMVTYLYHYGRPNSPLIGLFVSPEQGAGDLHLLESRREHAIGVVNFDLDRWKPPEPFDINAVKAHEKTFAKRLLDLLEQPAHA